MMLGLAAGPDLAAQPRSYTRRQISGGRRARLPDPEAARHGEPQAEVAEVPCCRPTAFCTLKGLSCCSPRGLLTTHPSTTEMNVD